MSNCTCKKDPEITCIVHPRGVLVFDLETQTHTRNKRKASPWHEDNYIVAAGFAADDASPSGVYYTSQENSQRDYCLPITPHTELLVGHNIKFDLLWSWDRPELQAFLKRGGKIWDTQYVEYLLGGHRQSVQMVSMDQCVELYGGSLKIDEVKELWKAGVQTADIDPALLMDYLLGDGAEIEGDINNTRLIYRGQLERIAEQHPNFMQMVEHRMDGLLATTEMEYNGIYIDHATAVRDRADLVASLAGLEDELQSHLPEFPPELAFNWGSVYHRSAVIFGGHIGYEKWTQHADPEGHDGLQWCKVQQKWPLFGGTPVRPEECEPMEDDKLARRICDGSTQDMFKSGKRQGEGKTKLVTVDDLTRPKGAVQRYTYPLPGYVKPDAATAGSLTDPEGNPIYATGSEILEKLTVNSDVPFLRALGERNAASKLLGTYYWVEDKHGAQKGMLTLVGDDNIIHHSLNHTSTVTSRMSGSNPNMQNVPRKGTPAPKSMMVSRFGDDGVMCEVDYSQLEVVVQGILSNDKQLKQDLNDGVDFHCKRLAAKLGRPYDEVRAAYLAGDESIALQRTGAKSFSFERAYGAGAHSIAASTGMTVEDIEALIDAEEKMYPGLAMFDEIVEASINATRVTTNREIFVKGQRFNAAIGQWVAPTGTTYIWTEHEVPEFLHKKGKFVGFSPTERKNWPVQGTGGEIVQTMIGLLYRWMRLRDHFDGKALLVNTVHDCVWLDMHKDVVDEVVPYVCNILENVPRVFNQRFGMRIDVPFPVEAEVGPNMLELNHYETKL